MKRFFGILTALALLMTCCFGAAASAESSAGAPLTCETIQALNGGNAVIHTSGDRVTFVGGTCTSSSVQSPEAAADVVEAMIPLMGGDGRTHFEPVRTLCESFGNT